jgi:hypothetical protein
MPRQPAVVLVVLALLAILHDRAHAGGELRSSATCTAGDSIAFSWTFTDNPNDPTGRPDWVGYDIQRRTVNPCGAYVRVNAQPFPRLPGSHGHTYVEAAPGTQTMYEYRVIFVDSNRQEIQLSSSDCFWCGRNGWASCPLYSTPITHGTLQDLGWAIFVSPCSGCYAGFGLEPTPELRQYAGTGEALRFYGQAQFCDFEGCFLGVDHYELAACPQTPVRKQSWGGIKAIHR